MQFALLREAASLVVRGVVDATTVDRIVRDGLGRRWSLIGPFETMALGGRETFLAIARRLFPDLVTTAGDADLAAVILADRSTLVERLAARDSALAAWRVADR